MSVEPLTAREEEVLRLVVEGLCNKSIGRRLDIAVGTVKSHLKSSFDKLDVCSRTQAMAAVERRGLLREPPQRPDLRRPCDVDRVPDAAARDAFERASTRGMRGLAARRSVLPEDSLQFLRVAGFG
ncbi:MAG: LuxR C-terminal-related transcriptional regulator [Burkholderiaceae bacterium]